MLCDKSKVTEMPGLVARIVAWKINLQFLTKNLKVRVNFLQSGINMRTNKQTNSMV
jgi:hypothetical protein